MSKGSRFEWKVFGIGVFGLAVVVGVFLAQSVVMVRVVPVEYAAPPNFAEDVVEESVVTSPEREGGGAAGLVASEEGDMIPVSADESAVTSGTEYTLDDLENAQSSLPYIALMKDDNAAVRLEALKRFIHPDVQRAFGEEFWDLVEGEESAYEAVFYEGLVDAVKTDAEEDSLEGQLLLIALSHLPGRDEKSIEMIAWASNNHASPKVRDLAMHYVVEYAPRSEIAREVVRDRGNDPDPSVRWHAFGYRFELVGRRFYR